MEKVLSDSFNKLMETGSRIEKENLIENYIINVPMFIKTISFLCDSNIVTNLALKKIKKNLKDIEVDREIKNYTDFINYLTYEVSGTDESIKVIQNYIYKFPEDVQNFLIKVAIKNLKFGVTVVTLNKVLLKLNMETIFQFNVQLAKSYKEFKNKELKKNPNVLGKFFITQKLDGLRFCVIKENGKVKAYSRQGKLQIGYNQILNEFSSEKYPDNTFYDGEVIAKNDTNLNSGDLYRKTMSITGSKSENKTDLDYFIFDIVPLQEFKNGKSKKIYSERRLDLEKLPDNEFIHVVPLLYSGYDITKIDEIGENALANNLEGIMINTDSIYQAKRVKTLLKYKQVIDCDGVIKGVYEGTNKNKGKLGGLIITYKDSEINVGSGFSDYERETFWKNPDAIIGKIGWYQISEESTNKNSEETDVRFARWKGLRLDKSEKDVNYEG